MSFVKLLASPRHIFVTTWLYIIGVIGHTQLARRLIGSSALFLCQSNTSEFATVGYRAHAMIHGEFEMAADLADYTESELADLEAQGIEIEIDGDVVEFAIPLNIAFGRPQLLKQIGLDAMLLGLASEAQYANTDEYKSMCDYP